VHKETINANGHSKFAGKFLASFFCKATRLNSFTTFRQRYFQNSFTWNNPRKTHAQEVGNCFKRENLNCSLKQSTRPVVPGGDK